MPAASLHRRTRGVARHGLLIVVLLIAASAAGIYWKIRHRADADEPAAPAVSAGGPIVRDGAGIDGLLQHARQAMAEQRLLAPAGDNAFESYLAVLKREPGNRVAQDALREIFPFAAHAAEQAIDEGNDAEAQREVELLARAPVARRGIIGAGPPRRHAMRRLPAIAMLAAGVALGGCHATTQPAPAPVHGYITDTKAFDAFIATRPTPAQFRARYPDVQLLLPGDISTMEMRYNNSRYYAELDKDGRIAGGRFG